VGSRKTIVSMFWPQVGITVVKNDDTCTTIIQVRHSLSREQHRFRDSVSV
jgi:hypothetical protein